MDRLNAMDDRQLQDELKRLTHDVEDFRVRAAAAAGAAECQGRDPLSDPLRQRLASIHKFLENQLQDVDDEMRRRAVVARRGSDGHCNQTIGLHGPPITS